jgi:RHS repeat-associated protein
MTNRMAKRTILVSFAVLVVLGMTAGCGGPKDVSGRNMSRAGRVFLGLGGPAIDRALGFETPTSDWTNGNPPAGTLGSSTAASQGTTSLAVQAHGYIPIQSVALSSLGSRVGTALQVDVQFQGTQPNPWWWGTVTIGVDIPSLGVLSGQAGMIVNSYDLTGKLSSGWTTLSFGIPIALQTALAGSYDDLKFTITLNVPSDSTGSYLIDNLRFLGGSAPAKDERYDGGPSDNALDGGIPSGTAMDAQPCVLLPPANVAASADDSVVRLLWTASEGATSYRITRTDASGPFATSETSYTDTSLVNGTTYTYTVTAVASCGESPASEPVSATPLLATKITLHFPKGVGRDSVVFGANGTLKLNDRDKVQGAAGNAGAVSNAGSGETNLGAASSVGSVTSVASVTLRSNAQVKGDLTTAAATITKQPGAHIGGELHKNATLTPLDELSWTVHLPTTNNGPVALEPNDQPPPLVPGSYSQVTAKTGAILKLSTGTYYFNGLDLESGSKLHLDKTSGPIAIYVSGAAILRGDWVDDGGPEGDLLLVCLGSMDIFVEQVFTGTIVVPNAKLSLATLPIPLVYRGTFFARDIESHQDNTIQALSFGWDKDCVQFGCGPLDQCHLPGVCDSKSRSCTYAPKPDGTACSEHPCSTGELCKSGACSGGATKSCDDGDACTNDSCGTGGCNHEIVNTQTCIVDENEKNPFLVPFVDCVVDSEPRISGLHLITAILGYQSSAESNLSIPVGSNNQLSADGSLADQAPPLWFTPGTHRFSAWFSATSTLTWNILGQSVTASSATPACEIVAGQVNTESGPMITVDPVDYTDSLVRQQIVPTSGVGETDTAGRTAGSFAVTDDGAATYQIPISVPPALGGTEPHLSLSYNSGAGDVLAGQGWNVSGLSAISRCPLDYAREKASTAITFDDAVDVLCLDGQRLVLVNAQAGFSYNQAGAEYRLETDRTVKIIQVGADSLGPTGFLVYTQDGLMSSYGYDSKSSTAGYHGSATAIMQGYRAKVTYATTFADVPKVHYADSGESQVRLSWGISAVSDRFSNRTDYTYDSSQTAANGYGIVFRPKTISWPNGTVTFEYKLRTYPRTQYLSGLAIRNDSLIDHISVASPNLKSNSTIRTYRLNYEQDGYRVLLDQLQECDGSGICLQPTAFMWTPPDSSFDRIDTGIQPDSVNGLPVGKITTADLNGDGRDDILPILPPALNDDGDQVGLVLVPSDINTLANRGNSGIPTAGPCSIPNMGDCHFSANDNTAAAKRFFSQSLQISDVYGSGFPTLFFPTAHRQPSSDSDWLDYAPIQAAQVSGAKPLPGASTVSFDYWTKRLSASSLPEGVLPENWSSSIYVGDFDGDGLPDLVRANRLDSSGNFFLFASNASAGTFGANPAFGPFSVVTTDLPSGVSTKLHVNDDSNVYVADIDGDGKMDLLHRSDSISGASARMFITKWPSAGGNPQTTNLSLMGSDKKVLSYRYQFADINGDGLVDAIQIPNSGGDVKIAFNTGRDFLPLAPLQWSSFQGNRFVDQSMDKLDDSKGQAVDPGLRIADLNSDGVAELVLLGKGCFSDGSLGNVTLRSSPVAVYLQGGNAGNDSVISTYSASFGPTVIGSSSYDSNTAISGGCGGGYSASQVLDINGDGLPDFLQVENGKIVVYVHHSKRQGLLQTVKDGYGHKVDVSYLPVTRSDVHTPVQQCAYPQYCNVRGSWVVASHTFDTGTAAQLAFNHTYSGARASLTGLGSLGMDSHTVTDANTNSTSTVTYDHVSQLGTNIYPIAGIPVSKREVFKITGGQTITKESTSPTPTLKVANGVSSLTFLETDYVETEATGTASPAVKRKVVTKSSFDEDYGYLKKRTTETGIGSDNEQSSWQPTFYDPNYASWLVGLVQYDVTSSYMPARADLGMSSQQVYRSTQYERADLKSSNPTGAVSAVVEAQPGLPNIYLRTELTRNAQGQVIQKVAKAATGDPRTVTIGYDGVTGIFPAKVTNALGMSTETYYHPGLGVPLATTDVNGRLTLFQYDGFGRQRFVQRQDGGYVRIGYGKGVSPVAMTVSTTTNDRIVTADFDFRGLKVRTDDLYSAAGTSEVLTVYDSHGRLWKKSRPYNVVGQQSGDPDSVVRYTTYSYDEMGRPISIEGPKSSKSWSYSMNSITFKVVGDDTTESNTSEFDGAGRLKAKNEWVQPTGEAGHNIDTSYGYAPYGLLSVVQDAKQHQFKATYDIRGRRTGLVDPDVGTVTDDYNGFGDHITHTAGKITESYTFDALGRPTAETLSDGESTFEWDTAANGIGMLSSSTSKYSGAQLDNLSSTTVTNRVEYDSNGHLSAQMVSALGGTYRTDYAYDALGRRQYIQYPLASGARYKVQLNYNSVGYLESVSDPSQTVWSIEQRNAALNVTEEAFGDGTKGSRGYEPERGLLTSTKVLASDGNELMNVGYAYGTRGYLQTRTNYLQGETEEFTHDEIGRLMHWGASSKAWHWDYSYDDIGNMIGLSQTGGEAGPVAKTFTPGDGTNGGPHAIARTDMTFGGGATETDVFEYDLRGRQKSAPGRTVTYADFGLPRTITKSTGEQWSFLYDSNHQRVVKSGATRMTVYLGSLYEQRIESGGTTHVMYVPGEQGIVAQVTQVEGSRAKSFEYLHSDPLGSTAAITKDGSIGAVMRFDPFGQRLSGSAPPKVSGVPSSDVTLGFIGQESDDDLGLINLNGRIYDPTTARFLTPDPVMAMMTGSQGLNRYSYTINSPLKFVDTSGYHWWSYIPLASYVVNYLQQQGSPSINENGASAQVGVTSRVGVSSGNVWGKYYGPQPIPESVSGLGTDDQLKGITDGSSGGSGGPVASFEQTVTAPDEAGSGETVESVLASAGYTGVSDAEIADLIKETSAGTGGIGGGVITAFGKPVEIIVIAQVAEIVAPVVEAAAPVVEAEAVAVYTAVAAAVGAAAAWVVSTISDALNSEITTKDAEREFRTNPDFRDYVHKDFKPDVVTPDGKTSNPDLTPEQIKDAWDEWDADGRPRRR